ncbi:calcium homeostasis modulator protein 6-like [Lethenteron reissneri]|uniref:calcium homeostasis modulator protein 6-like n=1 Tax=Lethenteron reissneri TaxID=7753 RepID=UPI002AB602A3|nr:calcium homeostasis modulator protein 6-like [Lethenteron reissneri]
MEREEGWLSRLLRFRKYLPSIATLITGVIMPILSALAGKTFTFTVFHCPCTWPENATSAYQFLRVPALVLIALTLMIQARSIHKLAIILSGECLLIFRWLFFVPIVIIMRNSTYSLAPLIWLTIAYFHGDAYVCGQVEFVNLQRFPALNNVSFASDQQRNDVLAKVPCENLEDPFLGLVSNETNDELRKEIVTFLRAKSQDMALSSLVLIIFNFILVVLMDQCIKIRRAKIETLFKNQYAQCEQRQIDEKLAEFANRLAEQNAIRLFEHLDRVRQGSESLSLPPGYEHLDDGESGSPLDRHRFPSERQQRPPASREPGEALPLLAMEEREADIYQAT